MYFRFFPLWIFRILQYSLLIWFNIKYDYNADNMYTWTYSKRKESRIKLIIKGSFCMTFLGKQV